MITQAVLDFVRDMFVNWISGFDSLLTGIDAAAAGAAIGAAASNAGHLLALFIDPGWWSTILAAWTAWIGVWLITGLIAIIARRGKA